MPWKEVDVMSQRLEFVLRALHDGEPFLQLCREYGIARKTGYKWKQGFLQFGISGLGDESRRPESSPEELGEAVVCELIRLKQAHRNWGARKLRAVYGRMHGLAQAPSESSCKRILEKAGLVEHGKLRRSSQQSGRLQHRISPQAPNELWTVDFKGWWHCRDGQRCEPLTVRDAYSRYLLCVWPAPDAKTQTVRGQFQKLFERYGLPATIRSDNGSPFASVSAPLGLSRLSAWWLALGIDLDRGKPGHPEDNGGHERMHRDLAAEVEYGPSEPLEQVQAALELFQHSFNYERPHEALGMKTPAELYVPSSRKYSGEAIELSYPAGYLARQVVKRGQISVESKQILISSSLAGWPVGLKPEREAHQYAVYFGKLCLGRVDAQRESFTAVAPRQEVQEADSGALPQTPGFSASSATDEAEGAETVEASRPAVQ